MKIKNFEFIDMFSGIGGFHQAMSNLGGNCVFASEIDRYAIETYKKNYSISSDFDIKKIEAENIPMHDVFCAGFPCQTFSKAGKQAGMRDTRGTLFFEIERILEYHKTKYIILENVRNLVSHDNGYTWETIQKKLNSLGYRLTEKPLILSPHQFGVPQLRERVFIIGIHDPFNVDKKLDISFDNLLSKSDNSIYNIIDNKRVQNKYYITEYENLVLNAWDEFYKGIDTKIIGFPIWAEFFKVDEIDENFPKWKKNFVLKNKELYNRNRFFIDGWLDKYNNLDDFVSTHRKMEWQAGLSISSLWDGIIQFRPSGIRVKGPDCFPALVAVVQIPIIGKYKRRLTVKEVSRLQSFSDSFISNSIDQQAYKQFGNSVNVKVVESVARKLLNYTD